MTENLTVFLRAVERIGHLLTVQPNPGELREKEAVVKKYVKLLDPGVILRSCGFSSDSLHLLILLQILGRNLVQMKSDSAGPTLIPLLSEIAISPNTLKPTRFQALKMIAISIIRFTKPHSILGFMNSLSGISDQDRLYLITEIALVDPVSATGQTRELMESYGVELLPMILSLGAFDVLEKWIGYVPGSTLSGSAPFLNIMNTITDLSPLEDILVKCCEKAELRHILLEKSSELLASHNPDLHVVSLRMLSMLFRGHPVPESVHQRIKFLLVNPATFDMSFRDCVLSLLEESSVLDSAGFDLSLALTAFPHDIERRLPCRNRVDYIHRQRVNEDDPNDVIRYKFFELREDTRQFYRKAKLGISEQVIGSHFQTALNSDSWQALESLIHAIGAIAQRFESTNFILEMSRLFLSYIKVKSSHRALITTTVLAFLAFSKSLDPSILNSNVLPFVIESVASIDTIDFDSGWFDFRSKQDNSGVGFLHYISGESFRGRIDPILFCRHISQHLADIKMRIYQRDPFRQTRDIFVSAIVSIVMKNSASPGDVLKPLLPIMCDDTRDLAHFLIAGKDVREALWESFQPILSPSILHSPGAEHIVRIYAEKFSVQEIVGVVSDGCLRNRNQWIGIIPDIAEIHQHAFVQEMSSVVLVTLVNQIPPKWFKVLVTWGNELLWKTWLVHLWSERTQINSDLVPSVSEFVLCIARRVVPLRVGSLVLLVSIAISHPANTEPIEALMVLYSFSKELFGANCFSNIPPDEYRVLISGLEGGDSKKIRRFLKKFPTVFSSLI